MTTDPSVRGSASARTRKGAPARARLYVPVAIVAIIGLLASTGLFLTARQIERRQALEFFHRLASDRAHAVHRQVESELHALYTLQGFFHASEAVTFSEFEDVVTTMRTWAGRIQIPAPTSLSTEKRIRCDSPAAISRPWK